MLPIGCVFSAAVAYVLRLQRGQRQARLAIVWTPWSKVYGPLHSELFRVLRDGNISIEHICCVCETGGSSDPFAGREGLGGGLRFGVIALP